MSLGSVVHSVTSPDGSITFRASSEWEARDTAPGGHDGAKEVVTETWARRYAHVFQRDAEFVSYHEQSGEPIWEGTIRDVTINSGRADIGVDGLGKRKVERRAGRLLYLTQDLNLWRVAPDDGGVNAKWTADIGVDALFYQRIYNVNAIARSPNIRFTPATRGVAVSRVTFDVDLTGGGNRDAELNTVLNGTTDTTALSSGGTSSTSVDLTAAGTPELLYLWVTDVATNYLNGAAIAINNMNVYGIADSANFDVSSVTRDIGSRMGFDVSGVHHFGFNAMPLFFNSGETNGEALDLMALYADALWYIDRQGLHLTRWGEHIYDVDERDDVDLLPLPRYDKVVVPFRWPTGARDKVIVRADPSPLRESRSYGRVQLEDPILSEQRAYAIGERILNHLVRKWVGGSANLAEVSEAGQRKSAYLMKPGVLRHQGRRARGRIATKTMTTRGVSVELENNIASLDSLLARRRKRMERR